MKARRLSFALSLPLALGLLGCARDDDGTAPTDVPTRTEEAPTPPQDETGIPPVPNETGRESEGSRTGPQPTDMDQTQPGSGAND